MLRIAVFLFCLLGGPWAWAQVPASAPAIRPGERLSDWLLRQPIEGYMPGLGWNVPAQRLPQAQIKYRLLAWLAVMPPGTPTDDSARQRLANWIKSLPVTGRVPIALPDARWLQAHPDKDPLLDADHEVVLPRRPTGVVVLTDAVQHCEVPHLPGAETISYLSRCEPERASRVDHAWIVQPDGRVRRFGVASWNGIAQDEPAPGALIWAPSPGSQWPEPFSALLAEFLATQDVGTLARSLAGVPATFPALATGEPSDLRRANDIDITANDWGLIGLLQTPTARMAPASDLRVAVSRAYPYSRASVVTQPFDWMEAGFRYSFISTRNYWASRPDVPYADKSMDLKIRLATESRYLPELAVGTLDMTGTGLFSSEYLVASKRWRDFDASLGIAWGYLGRRGNLGAPLAHLLGDTWKSRQVSVGRGGNFSVSSYFRGPAALFGGVQYRTPWENVLVKLEFDGNNYQLDPTPTKVKQSSPINAGIVYRVNPSVDVTAGIERGNTATLNVVFHGLLDKLAMPKIADPPPVRVTTDRPAREPDWSVTAADLTAQTLWKVAEIGREGNALRVVFAETGGAYRVGRIDRAVAVLHRDAPADIDRFVLAFEEGGIPLADHVVLRNAWVMQRTQYQAWTNGLAGEASIEPTRSQRSQKLWSKSDDSFSTGVAPSFGYILASAGGYFVYHVGAYTHAGWRITDSTWLSGGVNFRLIDNFEKAINSASNLQRVRTFQKEYVKTAQVTLPNIQLTHVGQLARNQYYSLYGGMLEPMFAGVGGEWLYRSWHSPIAFGVDVNRVAQRAFQQDLSLLNPRYDVTTGHASLYLDSGWKSVQLKLSAGRYLAGDRGATIEAKRTFANGVAVGGYLTRTNLSAVQFGEGSFDKGVFVSIPYDAQMPFSSPATGTIKWSGLVRDGGQKLARTPHLYELTDIRGPRNGYVFAEKVAWDLRNDTAREAIPKPTLLGDLTSTTTELGRQIGKEQWGPVLLTGGAVVLATSLLDRRIDTWAKRHQGGAWNKMGKAANAIPFALAAGASLLWMGAADEMAAETAWTSIKAAGITVATETAAKYAIGRARPDENLGNGHFSAFGNKAANSSLPSIHLGAAYALATPFAQKYDAPWLYALAGATAFGRIQQRQHFVSDTVAGGLIGYAFGSLLLDQQRGRRISLSPTGVQVSWEM